MPGILFQASWVIFFRWLHQEPTVINVEKWRKPQRYGSLFCLPCVVSLRRFPRALSKGLSGCSTKNQSYSNNSYERNVIKAGSLSWLAAALVVLQSVVRCHKDKLEGHRSSNLVLQWPLFFNDEIRDNNFGHATQERSELGLQEDRRSCSCKNALFFSMRLKRQSAAYVPSSCNTCGELGYGQGLGSYFYGQMGGGVNNNYGGTNIGKINVKNINA